MTHRVVTIGSGIGALACGAALSSVGTKVTVLEKHHTIGGYLQGFSRGQWHFNVGTHYVGDLGADAIFYRLMEALTDGHVVWRRLDDIYERISADGYGHEIISNIGNAYLRRLQQEFPKEEDRLSAFFKLLEKVRRKSGLLFAPKLFTGPGKYVAHALNRVLFFNVWHKTVQEVLDRYFSDERLKMLLAVHCDKTGLRPDEASFLSWAVIQNSYQNGACYPEDGGEVISDALLGRITANGGTVRIRAGVEKILLNGRGVTGVLLRDGEVIECDRVVSDIGIIETAKKLMPEGRSSPRQRAVARRYMPSGSYMTLHVGFEGNLSSLGIQNANYRVLQGDPYDFTADPLDEGWRPANVLITFPSMRDTAHTDMLHHTAEMLVPVQFRHFEKWVDTKVHQRGRTYEDHKKRIAGQLTALLDRTFPGIAECVAFTDLSTPLTYREYCGHTHGAAYGLASRIGRTTDLDLHPVSDVKGLYYTGADVFSQGITGAFMSGIFTAVTVSGKLRILGLRRPQPKPVV